MIWWVATPPLTSGVSDAVTTGARGGIAATVAGSAAGAVDAGAGAVAAVFAGTEVAAGAAAGVTAPVISRTTWAARSASRRLRSSETLSVAVCRDFRACLGWALGLAVSLCGAASSDAWASARYGCMTKAIDAANASEAPIWRPLRTIGAREGMGIMATRLGFE